jgi:hypothetical protein
MFADILVLAAWGLTAVVSAIVAILILTLMACIVVSAFFGGLSWVFGAIFHSSARSPSCC